MKLPHKKQLLFVFQIDSCYSNNPFTHKQKYCLFWERKKRHPRSLSIPSRQIGRRQAHRSVALFEKLETDDQDATRLSRRATQKKKHSTNEASFLITTFVAGVEVTFLIRVTPVSLTN